MAETNNSRMHDSDREILERLCGGVITESVEREYWKFSRAWMQVASGPLNPLLLVVIAVNGGGETERASEKRSVWQDVPEHSAVVVKNSFDEGVFCEGVFVGIGTGLQNGNLLIAIGGDTNHRRYYPAKRVVLKNGKPSVPETPSSPVRSSAGNAVSSNPPTDSAVRTDIFHKDPEGPDEPKDDLAPSYLASPPPPWEEVQIGSPVWLEHTLGNGSTKIMDGKFVGIVDGSGALKIRVAGVHRGRGFGEYPPDNVRLNREALVKQLAVMDSANETEGTPS